MNSPCSKECPKRSVRPNCHMTCREYIIFEIHCELVRRKKDEEQKIEHLIRDHPKDPGRKARTKR